MASTYTNLLYHVVFSTKDRIPLIQRDLQERLYEYMGGIIRGEGGVLLEIGGVPDHVHLLTKLKADTAVAVMLRLLKSNSSKWVNEERLIQGRFGWQTGYAAFQGGWDVVARLPGARAPGTEPPNSPKAPKGRWQFGGWRLEKPE